MAISLVAVFSRGARWDLDGSLSNACAMLASPSLTEETGHRSGEGVDALHCRHGTVGVEFASATVLGWQLAGPLIRQSGRHPSAPAALANGIGDRSAATGYSQCCIRLTPRRTSPARETRKVLKVSRPDAGSAAGRALADSSSRTLTSFVGSGSPFETELHWAVMA